MSLRETLSINRAAEPKPAPGVKRFKCTISGPVKGLKPITFIVEAEDGKIAGNGVRKLIAVGRLAVEPA